MSKSIKKTRINYNSSVINAMAKKYTFTPRYIKQILADERTPIFADRIKSEYKKLDKEMTNILNNEEL